MQSKISKIKYSFEIGQRNMGIELRILSKVYTFDHMRIYRHEMSENFDFLMPFHQLSQFL